MKACCFRSGFWAGAVLVSLLCTGCNPFVALYFLFLLPPPKVPAACRELDKQKVAVVTYVAHAAQFQYPTVGDDLTARVVRQLKANVPHIDLIDPAEIQQWCDEHTDYELTEVGRQFEATRVLYLEIEQFSLYEHRSTQLYRGRAKIHLQVLDMDKDGQTVWEDYVELVYPGARPVAASDVSLPAFRLKFLQYASRRVASRFFSYRPDEDFTVN